MISGNGTQLYGNQSAALSYENGLEVPKINPGSPLSTEPQDFIDDVLEFQVFSPCDSKEVYDVDDDLAVPLNRDLLQPTPRQPEIISIHPEAFDMDSAIRKYGYQQFEDPIDGPKRRALLVGIKGDSLKGSHNDVDDTKALLIEVHKWKADEIMVLKDDDDLNSPLYPVRQTVIDHLFILVHNARPGDRLFIQFSGHGAQIEDMDGDETDKLDEVICCADGEIIVDDQLHDILVKPLPKGCRLTALFDCCTSGTGLDLVATPGVTPGATPSTSPFLKVRDLQPEGFATGVLDLSHTFESTEDVRDGGAIESSPMVKKRSVESDVIMWAACLDSTDSHEVVTEDGRYKGAMSHAFHECIRYRPEQSYRNLKSAIMAMFKKWNVPQQPQLTSSHKLDQDALFHI